MQRIGVFCGSRPGANAAYLDTARAFGEALVHNHTALVRRINGAQRGEVQP